MIDTVKIVTMIDKKTFDIIQSSSVVKSSHDNATGELFYMFLNDSCSGSYDSSLSIKVNEGVKYNFPYGTYYIELEGSYHKIKLGYNSHNGFYNLVSISLEMIKLVEQKYNIKLPSIQHWFLQRVDIAKVFDLGSQENVVTYINNLKCCDFPRRKLQHYENEALYLAGSTSTIKIYNKFLEFRKHDIKKFYNTEFDIDNYLKEIKNYIRFECEIKKRKLVYLYGKKFIRVCCVDYKELENIWVEEFKKLFKIIDNDLEIVQNREMIKQRLNEKYSRIRAKNLFNFYLLITVQGLSTIKANNNRSMYYKNLSDLRKAGIDFNQKLSVDLVEKNINFNPFSAQEIL